MGRLARVHFPSSLPVRYSFIVVDLHHLLLAGLPAHFESFSIGAGWCQALSECSVDLVWNVHLQGPRFSSGSALWPSHDGIRRMRWTNLTIRPCRKSYGRHKDSKRTRLHPSSLRGHRSTDRRNSRFLLLCFYCAQLAERYMSVTSVH
jgi:hypothetical protein